MLRGAQSTNIHYKKGTFVKNFPNAVFASASIVLGATVYSPAAMALSPPWYILQNQMKATIGQDAGVTVDDLKDAPGGYDLDVEVSDGRQAKALSTLLTRTHDFGGTEVHVIVLDSYGNPIAPGTVPTDPDKATRFFQTALSGNCFFVQVDPGNAIYALFLEFPQATIQFPADNLADAYGNLNLVAADAFKEILNLEDISGIGIGAATSTDVYGSLCSSGGGGK